MALCCGRSQKVVAKDVAFAAFVVCRDSMSKDLYKALKCFLVEFHDLGDYHATSNFTVMHHLHNLPHLGRPHCMHLPQNGRVCMVSSNSALDRSSIWT